MIYHILLTIIGFSTVIFSQEIYRKEWTSFYPCKGNKEITISYENLQALDENFYFYITIRRTLLQNTVISFKFFLPEYEKWTYPNMEFRLRNAVIVKSVLNNKEKNPTFRIRAAFGFSTHLNSVNIDNVEFCSNPDTDVLNKNASKNDDRIFTPNKVTAGDGSCGKSQNKEIEMTSLSESATESGDWPWHVLINRYYKGISKMICGGTLISKSAVVTAAHCFDDPYETLSVYIGAHDILEDISEQLQTHPPSIHPDYNKVDRRSDIAVLKLISEIKYSETIQPACLWHESDSQTVSAEFTGMITGWSIPSHFSSTVTLRKAYVPKVTQSVCMPTGNYSSYLSDQNFCVAAKNGSTPCFGDDGSGFMVFVPNGESGSWHIRGIVSYLPLFDIQKGKIKCDRTKPAILTDVALFTPWLREFVQ